MVEIFITDLFAFKLHQMNDPYYCLAQWCNYRLTTLISVEFLQFFFVTQIRMDVVIIIKLFDILYIVVHMYQ